MHSNNMLISNNILLEKMGIIRNLLNRIRFRRKIKKDESVNVVDSIAKARRLYKELSIKVHPDKNGDKAEIAEELMQRIVANRSNYAALLSLKKEVEEKLQK